MNNALHLSTTAPVQPQQKAARPSQSTSLLTRAFKAIAAFFAPGDDPAALRYIASKYNGEGD